MNEFMQMPSKVLNQPISKMNINRRISNTNLINNLNNPTGGEEYCSESVMNDMDLYNGDPNAMASSQNDSMPGRKNHMYDSQHTMASENAR
eukprot:CAMPEP_0176377184 /NCGR_PEP_ID=MMETSP0126-20121128/28707_1 /TAXON_ID=141414 ORGANISM="Strombidinopsis acuminatum, Strain SPMC142" /NCGR_SAMPLE_ID=MMETSP0126 /ASSEMBLY_ACC=CAM_ASM_000229 /LENGTH=90 /DNA_ID=CAMNT_0017738913 /DNA_START=1767 /DNA_END=2039 /DNA_ORIENTATION=-